MSLVTALVAFKTSARIMDRTQIILSLSKAAPLAQSDSHRPGSTSKRPNRDFNKRRKKERLPRKPPPRQLPKLQSKRDWNVKLQRPQLKLREKD